MVIGCVDVGQEPGITGVTGCVDVGQNPEITGGMIGCVDRGMIGCVDIGQKSQEV